MNGLSGANQPNNKPPSHELRSSPGDRREPGQGAGDKRDAVSSPAGPDWFDAGVGEQEPAANDVSVFRLVCGGPT